MASPIKQQKDKNEGLHKFKPHMQPYSVES